MGTSGRQESDARSLKTKFVAPSLSVCIVVLIVSGAAILSGSVGRQRTQLTVSWSRPAAALGGSYIGSRRLRDPSISSADDAHYRGIQEHPFCAFLRSDHPQSGQASEHHWGPYNLCMEQTNEWYSRSRSNCYSCLYPQLNVCRNPPMIYYHQYLESLHPKAYEGNLLSIKAYLMTQDLSKSHMIVWVPRRERIYNNNTKAFFGAFLDYVTIRAFNYSKEVGGTPWEGDQFFGNATLVKQYMPAAGSYSDVVRILILHKYGSIWLDNDVVLYNDVTHLLATSYQFVMRWMNLHIMYMAANSTLTWRAMELAKTMPLNHPAFKEEILDKICVPNGYYPLVAAKYGNTDIYNGCLHRLLLRHNNTGLPPEATLYDLPLGWWDHDWTGCFNSRQAINDTHWHQVASTYLAVHNRYPGDLRLGPETSPLRRVINITGTFFKQCDHVGCLPVDGVALIAYEGLTVKPPVVLRRLLAYHSILRHAWLHDFTA